MQEQLNLKPTHKLVKSYYETLGQYQRIGVEQESAVRSAFRNLLAGCGHKFEWTMRDEYPIQRPNAALIKVDGALIDIFRQPRGYWEAKDQRDNLEKEIRAKLDKGYPRNNIIFQTPEKAILYQYGIRKGLNEDIRDSGNLVELLKEFFAYREPHHEEWDEAVAEFKQRIPEIAQGVKHKIEAQRRTNPAFVERFEAFYDVCRQSINPNLSVEAVETMLIQHLMTERIFRRIFDNPDFTRRNIIAFEIETVIDSMTAKQLSRDSFLKDLDRFYRAIELAAENTENYTETRLYQLSVRAVFPGLLAQRSRHSRHRLYPAAHRGLHGAQRRRHSEKGIWPLPQRQGRSHPRPIRRHRQLHHPRDEGDQDHRLPYKYENELHCNEVMLLPYYVASMNIEHEYLERTGEYQPFPGICLVDTFDMQSPKHDVCRGKHISYCAPATLADLRRNRKPAVQRRATQRERQQQK